MRVDRLGSYHEKTPRSWADWPRDLGGFLDADVGRSADPAAVTADFALAHAAIGRAVVGAAAARLAARGAAGAALLVARALMAFLALARGLVEEAVAERGFPW